MTNYLAFVLQLALLTAYAQGNDNLLIYNARIVQIETGAIEEGAILISGDKIKAVGSYTKLKRGVKSDRQVDAQGRYVIPGLWDMHIHLEGKDLVPDNKALLPVFLAYGVTTVRDCASDLGEQVLQWRKEIASGELIGPTIYTAGRKLEGKNSIWKDDLEIENESELNQMLDLLDRYKVDFVKITENTLGGDLFLKSVKAAHARGYRVSGHVPYDLTIAELHAAGYTSVEHASYLLRLGSDEQRIKNDLINGTITKAQAEEKYTSGFDQKLAIQKYKVLGDAGLFICPTLIGGRQLAYLDETDHKADEFLSYLTDRFTSNYQWRIERMSNETPEQRQQRKDRYLLLRDQLPLIQQSGIRIIAGSDAAALNTYVYPAEALLQELEIFQEAGLTPLQILQNATLNGARYFNVTDKTSFIAKDHVADLVLLNENPLSDVGALRKIHSVVKFGRYFSREELDEMLRQAREIKEQLDAQRK
ncbi:MAG: amidohydrolase family protein [Cyclobacteriaceae bacterium]